LNPAGHSNSHGFTISTNKTLSDSGYDKSHYKLSTELGALSLKYSNETLGVFFGFITEYIKLNVFRDLKIVQEFFATSKRRKTTAQRRIEMMMPFYIVKKLV
jgi:hypothetical protein